MTVQQEWTIAAALAASALFAAVVVGRGVDVEAAGAQATLTLAPRPPATLVEPVAPPFAGAPRFTGVEVAP